MRHAKTGRRFGMKTSHREAMFRNMVTSFLASEQIVTTDAKAKELRKIAEKMITLGKRNDLHAIRQAASYIREKTVVAKLFSTIAPRFQDRPGGYTRIIKLGLRSGDAASMSILQLVQDEYSPKQPAKKVEKSAVVEEAPVVNKIVGVNEEACEASAD